MPNSCRTALQLFILPLVLFGPAVVSGEPLTLEDAVQRAIERHPAIVAARDSTNAALQGVAQVESSWYPRINLNSYYRYVWPVAELTTDTGIIPPGETESVEFSQQIGAYHNAGIALEAGWRALDWGARSAAIEAAEASARAVSEDESLRAVDIAYAVRVAYLTSIFFAETETITERSLNTSQQELDDRQARLDAGLGSELEVASASARVAELEARQVDVRVQQELAHTTLRILLGLNDTETLELVDDLDVVERGDDLDLTHPSRLGDHPSIRQLDAMAEALELQANAVDRSFWPTLDLFANIGYQFPWTMIDVETAGFAFSAGVGLSWELFDGFARSSREDELRSRVAATVHARDANEEELTRHRLNAAARREAATAQLVATRRHLEAAETYLRVAQAAYSAGAGTALDVLTAEDAVDGARLAEAQSRFTAAVASADMLRASGVASTSETAGQPQASQE